MKAFYSATVLKHPIIVCGLLLLTLGFFSFHIKDFKLDASADSLLLSDDPDLNLFRKTISRYGSRDFLIVTFTPNENIFSKKGIAQIKQLVDELRTLPQVDSVVSVIDVPLLLQKSGSLAEIAKNTRTLLSADVDLDKARQELVTSPIYKDLVISEDATTIGIQVNLKNHPTFQQLQQERNQLLTQRREQGLDNQAAAQLQQLSRDYQLKKAEVNQLNNQLIVELRALLSDYADYGKLHLGGVAMITDDMISFIKKDLVVFGVGVLIFFIIVLALIFRSPRWIILPLLSCFYAGLLMLGLLGLLAWEVTVISSNFIALMLIMTMSMNIHLVVRYRQLHQDFPTHTQHQLVLATVSKMVWPCCYTALTTIIAFASLIVSGIKPVIDFGWMMTIALTVAFVVSFTLFPAVLLLLPKLERTESTPHAFQLTQQLSRITERHGGKVLLASGLLIVISLLGIPQLKVENSFVNYFSKDTEIYQGLRLIDEKLGGTTPLNIVINLAKERESAAAGDEFDLLFNEFADTQELSWFTKERIDIIKAVHDYLDSLPAVGKVLSLAAVIRAGEQVNQAPFDAFELAIVSKRMPAALRNSMITPYVSEQHNEARFSIRILDSLPDLRRDALLKQISKDLKEKFQLGADKVKITGILVLYNNMLQSLFRSQILTLGVVMLGIMFMLLVLFRSLPLAIIGIIPNILASTTILGLIGLLGIPLDMMTITIAAITIGIAVDNSIHYIYRFREELKRDNDYVKTMYYCHANIGNAVFYTATIIIVGFSILVLSNFIPTIYFGVLTALAMAIALLAALTLLPKLILLWRPFK